MYFEAKYSSPQNFSSKHYKDKCNTLFISRAFSLSLTATQKIKQT